MKVEQIYTGCIAHAAYYIENNGEAAIFDPLREVEPYINRANKDNAKVKYVFETHFHADFVSGHLDLASKTGAQIVYGPTAKPGFEAIIAEDNQLFKVGNYTVKVIHTPGHTMESTTYLLIDEKGKEHGIISGDTLFIGDVGRPDLAQHVIADLTEDMLAGYLYDSLHTKILPLSDDLIVYPNHGAGSACGKKMSKETTDTLGNQKKTNYALNTNLSKEDFKKELLSGLTTPPAYFPKNVIMNITGYDSLDTVLKRGLTPLSVTEFEKTINNDSVLILDCRRAEEFANGFIPDSLNIGLESNFAMWVGELVSDIKQKIVLVCPEGKEEEAIIRLARVGYDHAIGYLSGGFEAWKSASRPYETSERISAKSFAEQFDNGNSIVIDVRKVSEFESEHVENAINIPLNQLEKNIREIPSKQFYLHCAGGYRSMIAASILQARGFRNFSEIEGGYKSIAETNVPKTDFVCQSKVLK
jgi:glyoxylase-like metal-dependent hydrolase (beta-lactamase superfamily II)/rhodanese-related sulfurtransferase